MKNIVKCSLLLTLVIYAPTIAQDVMQTVFDVHYIKPLICIKTRLEDQIEDVLDKMLILQTSNPGTVELEALTVSYELVIKELKNANELSKQLMRATQSSTLLLTCHQSNSLNIYTIGSDIKDTMLKYAEQLRNAAYSLDKKSIPFRGASNAERAALSHLAVAALSHLAAMAFQLVADSTADQEMKAGLFNKVARALREAACALYCAKAPDEEQAAARQASVMAGRAAVTAYQLAANAYQLEAESTADQEKKAKLLSNVAHALDYKASELNYAKAPRAERATALQVAATAYQLAADSAAGPEIKAALLERMSFRCL